MTPRTPRHYIGDLIPRASHGLRDREVCKTRSAEFAYLMDVVIGQARAHALSSLLARIPPVTPTIPTVGDVPLLRSVVEMAHVAARWIVAGMADQPYRLASMVQAECDSVREFDLAGIGANATVSAGVSRREPGVTCVRPSRRVDLRPEPLGDGYSARPSMRIHASIVPRIHIVTGDV